MGGTYPLLSGPSNSPNLNPIEDDLISMKDFVQLKYLDLGSGKLMRQNQLRDIEHKARDFIAVDELNNFIHGMPNRLRAIMEEDGG